MSAVLKTLLSPIAVEIRRVPVRPSQHRQECPECQNRLNIALLILERLGDHKKRVEGGRRGGESVKLAMLGRDKWEWVVKWSH